MLCCEGAILEELVQLGTKEENGGLTEDMKKRLSTLLCKVTVFARASPE